MNQGKSSETKDFWRILESVAKFLGGLGAVLGAVLIPLYLHNQTRDANLRAAEDRKVQVYAQIMSQREAKDTEIRAKMFETLLSKYIENLNRENVSGSSPAEAEQKAYNIEILNQKIIFLSILMENFLEYFSAGPLFEDLYSQISEALDASASDADHDKLKRLREKLIDLCKHFAGKEITMLSRMGLVSGKIAVRKGCESSCYIPLFEVDSRVAAELSQMLENPEKNTLCEHTVKGGPLLEAGEERLNLLGAKELQDDKKYYAIGIKVREIAYPEVRVSITLLECRRNGDRTEFIPVRKEPFVFSVSYFDMPYMDNTRLFEGQRFAIVLKSICAEGSIDDQKSCVKPDSSPYAVLQVVTFKEEFMSLRDRPLFEDMLNKLKAESY